MEEETKIDQTSDIQQLEVELPIFLDTKRSLLIIDLVDFFKGYVFVGFILYFFLNDKNENFYHLLFFLFFTFIFLSFSTLNLAYQFNFGYRTKINFQKIVFYRQWVFLSEYYWDEISNVKLVPYSYKNSQLTSVLMTIYLKNNQVIKSEFSARGHISGEVLFQKSLLIKKILESKGKLI